MGVTGKVAIDLGCSESGNLAAKQDSIKIKLSKRCFHHSFCRVFEAPSAIVRSDSVLKMFVLSCVGVYRHRRFMLAPGTTHVSLLTWRDQNSHPAFVLRLVVSDVVEQRSLV